MKKILIIIVCTGMSIGLLVTGAGNIGKVDFKKAAAMPNPSTAVTCTLEPCNFDEVMMGRAVSISLSGREGHKLAKLQAELNDLKAELNEEVIAKIHHTLGKISVILGELNSTIDIETETLQKMSLDKQIEYEFTGILYIADTE